ncbi:hypothetical protein [Actinokineospora diospyrosa]|nr:hypothetical protein [Actinokineospora diospyrosa]
MAARADLRDALAAQVDEQHVVNHSGRARSIAGRDPDDLPDLHRAPACTAAGARA